MTEVQTEIMQTPTSTRRLPPWVIVIAFVLLLTFLTVLGLGLQRAQQGPITKGQLVPSIELTTFEGKLMQTKEMSGKVIVLNFWASWCKPCESEAADLEAAWKFYQPGEQVMFLGADYVDTEPEAKAYLKKFNITYPNGPDLGTRISQMFRIRGVPETYVIDRNGKLAYIQIGPFASLDEIKNVVDPLLK
ncbi:MAG: TlpA disulfide reductase family protein [Anaerolineaceae bacterium]|nr:TlpA disulfide reductase family protein [Anaerolineaceae bacterium]